MDPVSDHDDYPVVSKSDADLERAAEALRHALGFGPTEVPSATTVMERLKHVRGVAIVIKPDADMGDKEAYATSNPPRIFVRQSVYDAMVNDETRARMTLMHEAMHLELHPGAPKARLASGNLTPKFIKPHQSAERQARVSAAAFWLPLAIVKDARSADELRARCRVSAQAAQIRFAQSQRGNTRRPELAFVRDHIDQLKSLTPQRGHEATTNKWQQARRLWEALEHVEGRDPTFYRLCGQRTFMVAWLEFEKLSQCGWFISDNKVVAAMTLDRG
jgi:Zn-dependent peptidase ImmA (M78 family)